MAARKTLLWILALPVAILLWCGLDLYGPWRSDIRIFDSHEVARLDTEMWRSYYDRRPAKLFLQLADLMKRQFHFPLIRSYVAAGNAARAAFEFKVGRSREQYARALPMLVRYFEMIRRVSVTPFDPHRVAELELEWWIVHRQGGPPYLELRHSLADAAAALYGVPADSLADYARLRTEAMSVRDTRAVSGGVRDEDWAEIERLLEGSWAALERVVRPR